MLKSITFHRFYTICRPLSLLVRVSRSRLQATVHIPGLVLRLPGNVSCWMKAAQMALFLPQASLSISFCLATPHLSSQLVSPLLHTNGWSKGWLQTRAVKLIINILHFGLCLQGEKVYGILLYYCCLLYLQFSLIHCEIQQTESLPVSTCCLVHVLVLLDSQES